MVQPCLIACPLSPQPLQFIPNLIPPATHRTDSLSVVLPSLSDGDICLHNNNNILLSLHLAVALLPQRSHPHIHLLTYTWVQNPVSAMSSGLPYLQKLRKSDLTEFAESSKLSE